MRELTLLCIIYHEMPTLQAPKWRQAKDILLIFLFNNMLLLLVEKICHVFLVKCHAVSESQTYFSYDKYELRYFF
jgi:hypothetical protein